MAVTGLVSPKKMLTNASARVGDLLVLTKPLGTGIVTTGIKRGLTQSRSREEGDFADVSIEFVRRNSGGTRTGACGCRHHRLRSAWSSRFDVSCEQSKRGNFSARPFRQSVGRFFRLSRKTAFLAGAGKIWKRQMRIHDWNDTPQPLRSLLTDAQTSGGLLLCVPQKFRARVFQILRRGRAPSTADRGPDCARAGSTPMHDRLKSRREIPAVGKLLEQVDSRGLPHALVVKTIRTQLARNANRLAREKMFASESTTRWSNCVAPDCNQSSTAPAFLFTRISDVSLWQMKRCARSMTRRAITTISRST